MNIALGNSLIWVVFILKFSYNIKKGDEHMTIDTNTMVSISEANQNFSKVARLVDERGSAVILKNNVPRYIVIDFSKLDEDIVASDEDVLNISQKLMAKNREAYEVLAK